MAEFLTLPEAIAATVHDGITVALEGFTHLIPFAAGHEIIRQARRDLTLIRMTPDLVYDQMIGMGCARKLIFSWGGNPGVGSLHRLRDAVEHDWPVPLEIEEHSHAAMAAAYAAGAAGLPCAILRAYEGTDLAIIHAQRADRAGNVLIEGIVGVQKEVVLAARQAVVTVEEIVDDLRLPGPNAVVLPHWTVSVVVAVPGGARPSYAHGYYGRDNAFYTAWDTISRDRATFRAWMDAHVRANATTRSEAPA